LNFDEEVRRHLRDTGEQVTLTPGLVETVRLKALKRVRRRRQVLTGMTSIAAIALLTAVAANLLGGTDPAGTMQPASISESEDKADDETLESSNVELKTSVTATYETVPAPKSTAPQADEASSESSSNESWRALEAPVIGASTDYAYSGQSVVGRVGPQWYLRDGSLWRMLELPDSLDVIAVDLGAGEDAIRIAGWLGSNRCARELVIWVKEPTGWREYEVTHRMIAGITSSTSGARLRVTDHEFVLSMVEKRTLDAVCLLQSQGIDVVEAEIVDELIYATNRKAGRVIYSLEQFGPLEALEIGSESVQPRSLIIRSTDGSSWQETLLDGLRVRELGVVDGLIAVEDDAYTVHDGQRLNKESIAPEGTKTLFDAFVTPSEITMLFERDQKTWLRDDNGERPLNIPGTELVSWGRLGRVSDEMTMIIESQQGQQLFALG
tara:strand:+ start:6441 stop:7754 length:1314 start_codon:yes stop_codon:yes gene_type:complete